jgi:hypothetical protein
MLRLFRLRYRMELPPKDRAIDVWAIDAAEAVFLGDRRIGQHGTWSRLSAVKPWIRLRDLTRRPPYLLYNPSSE